MNTNNRESSDTERNKEPQANGIHVLSGHALHRGSAHFRCQTGQLQPHKDAETNSDTRYLNAATSLKRCPLDLIPLLSPPTPDPPYTRRVSFVAE